MNQNINMSMVKTVPNAPSVEERIKTYDEIAGAYTLEQAMEEARRCVQCPGRYCAQACPISNNIPEFLKELMEGNVEGAYLQIEKASPLPELCSRVCPQYRQCERNCTRGLYGEAVSIGKLEKFVADHYLENANNALETAAKTGKSVAIIGSGPAGLAAASKLIRDGYDVTVIEKNDRIGGLMMYGIPNMKLGKDTLEKKIDLLKSTGVVFEMNKAITDKAQAEKLIDSYDAVLLACGAGKARDICVEGRKASGIVFALDYLMENTKTVLSGERESTISAKGKDVIVIGGGDTGNDCVATAIRQGCKSVRQIEMMPQETDPRIAAIPWTEFPTKARTDYGQEEAIRVLGYDPRQFLTTVKEFLMDDQQKLTGVCTINLETAIEGTRVYQREILGTETVASAQLAIIAAGFIGCMDDVTAAFDVEKNKKGNVNTAYLAHATNKEKVFVAGDMRSGQSVVAKAVRDGMDAAIEIEQFLS